MFKGILPSKRTPSMDFTVLTQLADLPPGKENLPNQSTPVYPVSKPPKSGGLTLGKKKKSTVEGKKAKDLSVDVPDTEEAFDKLLVSSLVGLPRVVTLTMELRMTFKSQPLLGPSCWAWTLASRQPCSSRLTSSVTRSDPLPQ